MPREKNGQCLGWLEEQFRTYKDESACLKWPFGKNSTLRGYYQLDGKKHGGTNTCVSKCMALNRRHCMK